MGIRSLKNGNTNSLGGANSSVAKPTTPTGLSVTPNSGTGVSTASWSIPTVGATPDTFSIVVDPGAITTTTTSGAAT